jgi:hypothetical protein
MAGKTRYCSDGSKPRLLFMYAACTRSWTSHHHPVDFTRSAGTALHRQLHTDDLFPKEDMKQRLRAYLNENLSFSVMPWERWPLAKLPLSWPLAALRRHAVQSAANQCRSHRAELSKITHRLCASLADEALGFDSLAFLLTASGSTSLRLWLCVCGGEEDMGSICWRGIGPQVRTQPYGTTCEVARRALLCCRRRVDMPKTASYVRSARTNRQRNNKLAYSSPRYGSKSTWYFNQLTYSPPDTATSTTFYCLAVEHFAASNLVECLVFRHANTAFCIISLTIFFLHNVSEPLKRSRSHAGVQGIA